MAVITLTLTAIFAIIFGLIILIWPKALNLAVGIWLLIYGILQLIGGFYPDLSPYF